MCKCRHSASNSYGKPIWVEDDEKNNPGDLCLHGHVIIEIGEKFLITSRREGHCLADISIDGLQSCTVFQISDQKS